MKDDRVGQLLDSVAPLVRQGKIQEVCNILTVERDKSTASNRQAEAATLSSMMGSFLSIIGRNEDGLAAHVFAERVDPGNAQHALSTARYLFSVLNDPEAAVAKIRDTLARVSSPDHKTLHDAYSILGLCALRSQGHEVAVSYLQEAQAVARANNMPAVLWDFALAREIASTPAGRNYLADLHRRAQSEGDKVTEGRTRAILQDTANTG